MVRYLVFIFLLVTSASSLSAQTLKETIRGKYGEYQGTAETRMRGGKAVTVYKDKYGQVTGNSESITSSSGKTTTVYKDKYGQKTGTSVSKHSGSSGTITYKDKYGQVTGKGSVRGRMPSKSSSYSYGYSKGKGK